MLTRPFITVAAGFLPLLASGILASSSQAAPTDRLSSFSAVPNTTKVADVTGTTQAASDNLVGIVKSVNGSQLEVKLPDGQIQMYQAPPSFSTNSLSPGSFIEVTLDEAGKSIQGVKIPSVEKVVSGVISSIDGDTVTLELADGTKETTVINESTAERMNLAPGVPLTVTSYAGMTATKLCPTQLATCCQKPAEPIVLPPVAPPTVFPTGGGDIRPPRPQLW